jgi:hypothetical protein
MHSRARNPPCSPISRTCILEVGLTAIPRSDPRVAWREFLIRGFTRSTFKVQTVALEHLMDVAEDVPLNIQQLANA